MVLQQFQILEDPMWIAPINDDGVDRECIISVTVDDGVGLIAFGSYNQVVEPVHSLSITDGPSGSPDEPVPSGGTWSFWSVTADDSEAGHMLSYAVVGGL